MKKGSKIEVKENGKYKGQDMSWTETFTGTKIIGKGGEWVTHTSSVMIKKFVPKTICVHPFEHSLSYFESNTTKNNIQSKYNWTIYVYSIFLPEGFTVDTYSNDEYRFTLTQDMDIIYSGCIFQAKGEQKIINGRQMSTYIQYSDTVKPF